MSRKLGTAAPRAYCLGWLTVVWRVEALFLSISRSVGAEAPAISLVQTGTQGEAPCRTMQTNLVQILRYFVHGCGVRCDAHCATSGRQHALHAVGLWLWLGRGCARHAAP